MSPWECRPWREFPSRVGNSWTESITRRDHYQEMGQGKGTAQAEAWRWEELGEWLGAAGALGVERAAGSW